MGGKTSPDPAVVGGTPPNLGGETSGHVGPGGILPEHAGPPLIPTRCARPHQSRKDPARPGLEAAATRRIVLGKVV